MTIDCTDFVSSKHNIAFFFFLPCDKVSLKCLVRKGCQKQPVTSCCCEDQFRRNQIPCLPHTRPASISVTFALPLSQIGFTCPLRKTLKVFSTVLTEDEFDLDNINLSAEWESLVYSLLVQNLKTSTIFYLKHVSADEPWCLPYLLKIHL